MKKKLTEKEFLAAISCMELTDRTKSITYGVLVEGKKQTDFVSLFGITKSAVSLACRRVWETHIKLVEGYEEVTALLPKNKAFIVKKWAKEAMERSKYLKG